MNIKDYPFKVLEEFQMLIQELRVIISDHSQLVDVVNAGIPFVVKDADINSEFIFSIVEIKQTKEVKTEILYHVNPDAPTRRMLAKRSGSIHAVREAFLDWLQLLKKYSELNLLIGGQFVQQYQDEFYVDIKLIDPAADSEPFSTREQISFFDFLQNFKETLTSRYSNEDWQSVVDEVNKLQSKLTQLTKNQTIKGLSRILALSKTKGLDIFKIVVEVANKEIIKNGLYILWSFTKDNYNHFLPYL